MARRVRCTASRPSDLFESLETDDGSEAELRVDSVEQTFDTLTFDLVNTAPALANALRRILLSEVPTMAIEKVGILNNTSVTPDEVLAHRLGLIPLKADSRRFARVSTDDGSLTDINTLMFRLKVRCAASAGSGLTVTSTEDGTPSTYMRVLSRDLEWMPQGRQETWFSASDDGDGPAVGPVHDDIIITKLKPGQEIDLTAFAMKGTGKEHAKWSPVATASYRMLPEVRVVGDDAGDDAGDGAATRASVKAFDVEGAAGSQQRAVMARPRPCTMCRESTRQPNWGDKVELSRIKSHFCFSIESTGAVSSRTLFLQAIAVLREKCTNAIEVVRKFD
jgi:DNA-directed RNA polymerase I and III subunit RPAC1